MAKFSCFLLGQILFSCRLDAGTNFLIIHFLASISLQNFSSRQQTLMTTGFYISPASLQRAKKGSKWGVFSKPARLLEPQGKALQKPWISEPLQCLYLPLNSSVFRRFTVLGNRSKSHTLLLVLGSNMHESWIPKLASLRCSTRILSNKQKRGTLCLVSSKRLLKTMFKVYVTDIWLVSI